MEADGIHLGQDDLPMSAARKMLGSGFLIGISTHTVEQAIAASEEGADYIGFGPMFPTATKDAGPVRGLAALQNVRKAVSLPIIAIGGITRENAGAVIQAGADGVAVISAVLKRHDIEAAAGELLTSMGSSR